MLNNKELREELSAKYDKRETNRKRLENIISFDGISREGLKYNATEKRVHLYTTLLEDRIYAQLPGRETERHGNPNQTDFRPGLQTPEQETVPDAAFRDIFDVIEQIATQNKDSDSLPILAAVIYQVYSMDRYTTDQNTHYSTELIDISRSAHTPILPEKLDIYRISFRSQVWETLEKLFNDDRIPLRLKGTKISFQAFIEYLEVLVQNEDCKYYEKKGHTLSDSGRINTCGTILSIIYYYEGYITLSELLYRFSYGVAPFKVHDLPEVTDGIVTL